MKRYKSLLISDDLFLELFKLGKHSGYTILDQAVPADAKLINVKHAWPNGNRDSH